MQLKERPEATDSSSSGAVPVAHDDAIRAHGVYRFGLAYGRLVHRLRWFILAIWVIALAASVPFAAQLTSVLTGGGYNLNQSESVAVGNLIQQKFNLPQSSVLVVFQSADTPVSDPAYQSEVSGFIDRAQSFGHVTGVEQAGIGNDGKTTYVTINFDQSAGDVEPRIADLKTLLPSGDNAGPARVWVTGGPAIYREFTELTDSETRGAEEKALPIALVVLVIVFGTLVAAATPLLLALVAVPIALAIIYGVALHTTTSVFVLSVASIIGLGISIDYSLFMVRRFRDELRQRESVREAVAWTVATAGEAILFSGLTVIIGFIGLLLIGLQFMTSMGVGGAVVVSVAVLAALTLLPAILSILGSRVNAIRIPLLARLTMRANGAQNDGDHGFWHGLALGVMKRPVLIVLGVSALLLAMGWPIFSLNPGTPYGRSLPEGSEARQGYDILDAQFPGVNDYPILITAQTADGSSVLTGTNLRKVDALTTWLTAQEHVTGVTSVTQFAAGPQAVGLPKEQLLALLSSGQYQQNPGLAKLVASTTAGDTAIITVKSDAALNSTQARDLVNHLRANRAEGQGLTVQVGGFQAVTQDFNDYLYGNFPKAILFILGATYVLLLLMFRSVFLPLKAILMNVLSVSAAYGVLVLVFQWGYGSGFLNFTPLGFIDSTIPILLFCILFGLSMDYEVFLLSRIREEWLKTKDNRYAVARGLEKTGGVITNAALLFVIVTGAFTFTSVITTKEIGLGMTVAVVVDALIIRTLLVPATMRLLGRWNWWLPGLSLPPKQPS
ncbi:MAG TPA: MMPL family transporter [Ktedonobacterales bacterium]